MKYLCVFPYKWKVITLTSEAELQMRGDTLFCSPVIFCSLTRVLCLLLTENFTRRCHEWREIENVNIYLSNWTISTILLSFPFFFFPFFPQIYLVPWQAISNCKKSIFFKKKNLSKIENVTNSVESKAPESCPFQNQLLPGIWPLQQWVPEGSRSLPIGSNPYGWIKEDSKEMTLFANVGDQLCTEMLSESDLWIQRFKNPVEDLPRHWEAHFFQTIAKKKEESQKVNGNQDKQMRF